MVTAKIGESSCEVTLEKYIKACEDWRVIAEKRYEDSVGAPDEKTWIRNRIEGHEKDIIFTKNGKKAILN